MVRYDRILLLLTLFFAVAGSVRADGHDDVGVGKSGRSIYDFYCYQCHAYSGNAGTLAAAFLSPPPRNFTDVEHQEMSREKMIEAVTEGRPGTAMVSFSTVLDQAGIARVVDFIRSEFMTPGSRFRPYHTEENGWPFHERFAAAFPFATGEMSPGIDPALLTPEQQAGRALYLGACVSCHDRGEPGELQWDLRPLSYPRNHYSHREGHLISGASPYAIHDRRIEHDGLTPAQARGQGLFESNCAFCHGMDGTGRNWIGRFMEPHARNLTDSRFASMDPAVLVAVVRNGIPGTSMPAWRQTLSTAEILDIVDYLSGVLARGDQSAGNSPDSHATSAELAWRRGQ